MTVLRLRDRCTYQFDTSIIRVVIVSIANYNSVRLFYLQLRLEHNGLTWMPILSAKPIDKKTR